MNMNVQKYRRGENIQLSKNFHLKEVECHCGGCPETLIDLDHIARLQQLRDKLNSTITITSGYRCPEHNKRVGGSSNSQHVKGTATDIKVAGMNPDDVADECEQYFDGVGRYDTFTHVDSRGSRARWDYRKKPVKKKVSVKPIVAAALPADAKEEEIAAPVKEEAISPTDPAKQRSLSFWRMLKKVILDAIFKSKYRV